MLLDLEGTPELRPGLTDTPVRVAKAWEHFTQGYHQDPEKILATTFDDGLEVFDEMVCRKDIQFFSKCEHHLETFYGYATIAYIPDSRVVGLSKLARLVDCFAYRLQMQERMTQQIAFTFDKYVRPLGTACLIKGKHLCECSRGVEKTTGYMVTSCLTGKFKEDPMVRAEFYSMATNGSYPSL